MFLQSNKFLTDLSLSVKFYQFGINDTTLHEMDSERLPPICTKNSKTSKAETAAPVSERPLRRQGLRSC